LGEFKPDYPSFSKRKNEEGRVDLLLQILADGSVGTVEILSSSGSSRLDKAAQNAAKQCPYAPALDENDRPIESTVNLSYIFRLNNE
jgi:protein TonB